MRLSTAYVIQEFNWAVLNNAWERGYYGVAITRKVIQVSVENMLDLKSDDYRAQLRSYILPPDTLAAGSPVETVPRSSSDGSTSSAVVDSRKFWSSLHNGILVVPMYYIRDPDRRRDSGIGEYADVVRYARRIIEMGHRHILFLPFTLLLPWLHKSHSPYDAADYRFPEPLYTNWGSVPEAGDFLGPYGYYGHSSRRVDYPGVRHRKMQVSQAAFLRIAGGADSATLEAFRRFMRARGDDLDHAARYLAFNHVLGNDEEAWMREGMNCPVQEYHPAVKAYEERPANKDFPYPLLIEYFKYVLWRADRQAQEMMDQVHALGMFYHVDIPFFRARCGIDYWLHRDWFEERAPGVPGRSIKDRPGEFEADQVWGSLVRWNMNSIQELGFEPFLAPYRYWLGERNAQGVRCDAIGQLFPWVYWENEKGFFGRPVNPYDFQSWSTTGWELRGRLEEYVRSLGVFLMGEQLGPAPQSLEGTEGLPGMGFDRNLWHFYSIPKWHGDTRINHGRDILPLVLHDGPRFCVDQEYGYHEGAAHRDLQWVMGRLMEQMTWLFLNSGNIPMVYAGDEQLDPYWLNNPHLPDYRIRENWATRMPLPGDSDFDEGVAEDMHRHRLWIGGELNRRLPVYLKVLYPEHAGPGEDLVIVVETDDLSIAAQEIAVHFGINGWTWPAAQLKALVLPDEIVRPSLSGDHYIEVVAREDAGHNGLRVFSVRLHVPAAADETSVPEAAIREIEFVMHMRDQWPKHDGMDFTITVYESLRETGSSSPVVAPENFCL